MVIQEQEKMEEVKSAGIKVVSVYKEYDNIIHPNKEVNDNPNWKQELRTAYIYHRASFSKVYPDLQFVTIDITNPFNELMAARTAVYAKARKEYRGNMVFTDTDILAYTPLPKDFWDGDWDIALTDPRLDNPLMSINEGIFFAKDTPYAQRFLDTYTDAACHTMQGLLEPPLCWWIGQLALTHAYTRLNQRINIIFLDRDRYNFTPDKPVATNAHFIHFKGNRKGLMKQYLAGLLGTDYINVKDMEKTV